MGLLNLKTQLDYHKSAAGAAKKAHAIIVKACRDIGYKPEIECFIWTPEQAAAKGYTKDWTVGWESGPYEWAITECQMPPNASGFFMEPYNGHMLCFYKD